MTVRQLLFSISLRMSIYTVSTGRAHDGGASLWLLNQVPQFRSFSEQTGYRNQGVGKGTKICQFPPSMQLNPYTLCAITVILEHLLYARFCFQTVTFTSSLNFPNNPNKLVTTNYKVRQLSTECWATCPRSHIYQVVEYEC